ncbi:MAG: arginyltransferase [Desulfobulbaceae bacterium]|nr:arginyltransferase [Desulfobulbaceae bacterium]
MTLHGEERKIEFSRLLADISEYFVDIPAECPYGLGFTALYRQAFFTCLPDPIMESFLVAGFRRNGNSLYNMACPECKGCVSLRVDSVKFKPNRNQKRVLQRNQDVTVELGPVCITDEKIDLLNRFFSFRYSRAAGAAEEYYNGFFLNSCTRTCEIRYRTEDRLIGVAVVDLGSSWLNAVYFFFDPDEGGRSPGTFNILNIIDLCRRQGIGYVYLGYWIENVRAMSYKANFKPHDLLCDGQWSRNYEL